MTTHHIGEETDTERSRLGENAKHLYHLMGFFEMLVSFVYYDTIKSTLGESTKRFAPYLLTCFFFILTMNLVGLIVIFPGGANSRAHQEEA